MNTVHADGHALNRLSRQVKSIYEGKSSQTSKTTIRKPDAKPHHVQRQDTDYDVKPSMQAPKTSRKPKAVASTRSKSGNKLSAVEPDSDLPDEFKPTQLGESEGQDDNWMRYQKLREKRTRFR